MPKHRFIRPSALLMSLALGTVLGGCQTTTSNPYRFERAEQASAEAAPAPVAISAGLQLILPQRLVEQRSPALSPQLAQLGRQLAASREQTVITIVTASRADFDYLKRLIEQGAKASPTLRYAMREQAHGVHSLILVTPA